MNHTKKKERVIDFRYNLRLYAKFLRKYRGLFVLLLFVIILIQISYVVDKFFFKVIVDQGTEFATGTLARSLFVNTLVTIGLIYFTIVLIKAVLKWLQIHLINQLEGNLIMDVKNKFFNHILYLSYNFHTTHKTGSLISRLIRGGRAIEAMTDVIVFNFTPLIIQLIVVGTSLLYFSWVPAFIVLLITIAFISYSFMIQKKQKVANIEVNDFEDLEKAYVSDYFTNIDSIKYFGKEASIKNKFADINLKVRMAAIKHWNYFRWLDSGHALILGIGIIALVYFPMIDFLNGDITMGTLVFIYTVFGTLFDPLYRFVHGLRNYYRAMADFESIFQYGKIENEVKNEPNAKTLRIREGMIEFKDVDFSYHKKKFFSKFNLKVPKDKKVALVGHSGCGKTTLIRLLYRLYDVDAGEILVDGKNTRNVKKESLRSELSIVPQECILFDDTIYNNVAFSRPSAKKEEVMKAMKFAQLDKVVKNFPKKEQTIVGERGVKLSGGEKQRVSIARAILADKKVLVLDEATSALDSETEHEIQKDLERLMEGRTSIIIAHRLSTIMKADKIVVMDGGKIVQQGTHKELINKSGPYKKLWKLQKGGYVK